MPNSLARSLLLASFIAAIVVVTSSVVSSAQSAAAPAQSAPTPSTPAEVETFAVALTACTPAKAAMPHPFVRGFVVEHAVAGESDAACDYSQTMPGKMKMFCRLSADGRKSLAADLRAMIGGTARGSTSAPPTWMRECEIEMPDGKRIPAAGGRGGGAPRPAMPAL